MPLGPDWRVSDLRRIADQLRTGTPRAVVFAQYPNRSKNAICLALARAGYVLSELYRAGREARIRAILAAGGGASEVMASESVSEGTAIRLISRVLQVGDRRHCRKSTTTAQDRAIYLSVRAVGFRATGRRLGMSYKLVRTAAHRYRSEVLPESPPFERRPPRATSGAGG